MKFITKQQEPKEWRTHCRTPGATFQAIPELKYSLLIEQGYLCCYCMSQITFEKMKVEHYKPRRFTNLILTYSNLFAACPGNYCSDFHCDTRKDNEELIIHPADPANNCEEIISYSTSGSLSYPAAYKRDIEELLNLNNSVLISNRKEALFGAALALKKVNYNLSFIAKKITEYKSKDAEMKFKPYCNAVLWLLLKKLNSN